MKLRHTTSCLIVLSLLGISLAQEPPTDIRGFVNSFRVWFDEELTEEGLTRAEVEVAEEFRRFDTPVVTLTFDEEQGPVEFNDVGERPDREGGDGIFTAAVRLDLSTFLAEQVVGAEEPQVIIESLQGFPEFRNRLVVGTQNVEELIQVVEGDDPVAQRFATMRELNERLFEMDPREIIDVLDIDPESTPILAATRRDRLLDFDFRIFAIPFPLFGSVQVTDIQSGLSLMIRDVGVVNDPARTFDVCAAPGTPAGTPGGPWTFAHLMTEMAKGNDPEISPEDFTLQWLSTWTFPQDANGILVSDTARGAQLQQLIIDPWLAASGGTTFDINMFPARLMAIVNRPDLADTVGYSQAGSGGEARFVFGLLRNIKNSAGNCDLDETDDPEDPFDTTGALPFTVIFEYGVNVAGCFDLKGWHQRWKDLDELTSQSAYNDALEDVTRQFTDRGPNPSQMPSALAQLRTNEIALGTPWELREFTLQGPGSDVPGWLDLVTVKRTPQLSLNNNPVLADYAVSAAADLLQRPPTHTVPNRFPTIMDRFLAATAPMNSGDRDTQLDTFWDFPGHNSITDGEEMRHVLSRETCSGCHARETDTIFTHIGDGGMRNPLLPATLSGFLTGIGVSRSVTAAGPSAPPGSLDNLPPFAVINPVASTLNPAAPPDLNPLKFQDLDHRREKLAGILNKPCFFLPFQLPIREVH